MKIPRYTFCRGDRGSPAFGLMPPIVILRRLQTTKAQLGRSTTNRQVPCTLIFYFLLKIGLMGCDGRGSQLWQGFFSSNNGFRDIASGSSWRSRCNLCLAAYNSETIGKNLIWFNSQSTNKRFGYLGFSIFENFDHVTS